MKLTTLLVWKNLERERNKPVLFFLSCLETGQFVQLKLSEEQEKPSFMAVATAPPESSVAEGGTMGLLVKVVPDTPAEELCKLPPGAEILVSPVMGPGFPIEQLSDTSQVFLVCTGSGLAPIKSLIESDALQGKNRHSITLVYGVHSKEHNPCTDDTLASWQSHFNVDTVLVYSDEGHGYVQDELKRRKENIDGAQAGACLCGQKEMVQDVKSVLSEAGVPEEKMLLNF